MKTVTITADNCRIPKIEISFTLNTCDQSLPLSVYEALERDFNRVCMIDAETGEILIENYISPSYTERHNSPTRGTLNAISIIQRGSEK